MSKQIGRLADEERERLRGTFDEVAELYDRVRPGYPTALLDDLALIADLAPGSRVLEIGAGTGRLTVALAERGYRVVAVELGPGMAAVARRKLSAFGDIEVVVAPFEEWPLPDERFDAVVSATAFHWLDPLVRVPRAAAALRSGGTLATIATHHVAGGTVQFFVDSQVCYNRWYPNATPNFRLPRAAEIRPDSAEIDRSGLFGPVEFRRYEWEETYSSQHFLDLLRTYSETRTLSPGDEESFLTCIGSIIDERFAGSITKRYLTELRTAHQRALTRVRSG